MPRTEPIGPNHDLRSLLIPLGPVAVFGSSNFPLAYGVCGGDTASALAAGCSVIIKEHPAHPITGRLLATIAQAAINLATNEPRASASGNTSSDALQHVLQYIPNEDPKDFSIAQQLVQNSRVTAVGFTGSTRAGFALQTLCNSRPGPIPIFAEMGSLNCVFICPDAFARRADAIADELAASAMARIGQQCTKPGVVFVLGESELRTLNHMIRDRLLAAIPRRMLSRTVADNYYRRLDETAAEGSLESTPLPTPAQRRAALGVPVIFSSNDLWNETRRGVWEEIFGPAMIIARYNTTDSPFLLGALTLSIYAESEDIDAPFEGRGKWRSDSLREFLNTIRARAGRIIFNTPPTGVRVATSMVHGGPFPATNRPDTTAVGPRAIERWCRPICYQNCPDILLPPELQNANPRHLHRTINGEPTAAPIP